MLRRKFKGSLLAVSLLAFGAMTACTIGLTSCEQAIPIEGGLPGVSSFSITNKSDLQAEWHAGDGNRMIEFSFGDATVNVRDAIAKGQIQISSSDTSVITASGLYLISLKEGKATITVTVSGEYQILSDSVEISVAAALGAPDAQEISIADLLKLDLDAWENQDRQNTFEVTGVVGDWYGKDSSGSYGKIDEPSKFGNFYLVDSEDSKVEILVYGATTSEDALVYNSDGTWSFNNPQDFINDKNETPVVKGDTVTLNCIPTEYNGTIQLNAVITDIVPAPVIDYESITISAEKTTLKLNEFTRLSETHKPEDVNVGSVTYEVTEGEEVIEIIGNRVYGRKAGTAKIVGKGGKGEKVKVSEPITITVTEELADFTTTTIESLYKELPLGKDVYFTANYLGSFAGDQTYGAYVNYGDYAILLYKTEIPSSIKTGYDVYVSGTLDIYNGLLQIADADVVNVGKNLNVPNVSKLDLETLDGIDGYDSSRPATVTGTVSEYSVDEKYGNVEFTVTTKSGAKINAYADSRYTNGNELTKLNYIKDGDEISLKGNISYSVDDSKTIPTTTEGMQLVNLTVTSDVDIPQITIGEAYKLEKGTLTSVYGKYIGNFNEGKTANGIFIGDGEYSLYVYRAKAPEGTKIGDSLIVTGELDIYNGLFQMGSGATVELDSQNRGTAPEVLNLTSLEGIDGTDAGKQAKVTGTIESNKFEENKQKGYSTVTTKVKVSDTLTIEVRTDSRYSSAETFEAMKALKEGGNATIVGFISFYNDKAEGIEEGTTGLQLVNPHLETAAE